MLIGWRGDNCRVNVADEVFASAVDHHRFTAVPQNFPGICVNASNKIDIRNGLPGAPMQHSHFP